MILIVPRTLFDEDRVEFVRLRERSAVVPTCHYHLPLSDVVSAVYCFDE